MGVKEVPLTGQGRMRVSLLLTLLILVIILAAAVDGKKKPSKKPAKAKPAKAKPAKAKPSKSKPSKGKPKPSKAKPSKQKPSKAKPSKPKPSKPKPSKGKPSKQQKENIKMFNNLKKETQKMTAEIEALKKEIEAAEKLTEVSDRHLVATNDIVVVDQHYTGNQCGQFTLSSFSSILNVYLKADGTTGTAPFSGGTFTAPVAGWYHICSVSRFKNSGNSNDVTILTGGSTVIGGYGSAVTYDWRSTGICLDQFLAANTQVTVKHQSGGGSDCIQSTGWPYNKFTVHTIGNA